MVSLYWHSLAWLNHDGFVCPRPLRSINTLEKPSLKPNKVYMTVDSVTLNITHTYYAPPPWHEIDFDFNTDSNCKDDLPGFLRLQL